jgi:hypothetical protein
VKIPQHSRTTTVPPSYRVQKYGEVFVLLSVHFAQDVGVAPLRKQVFPNLRLKTKSFFARTVLCTYAECMWLVFSLS